jgi:CYTH domain-containing protein
MTETGPGPGWHPEIERKFLLDSVPEWVRGQASVEIEQGWLPGSNVRVRLRRERSATGVRLLHTEKRGHGADRIEREWDVAPADFEALWPATASRRIRKRRWRIAVGARCWEIDEFCDRSLALAEVELPEADTPVSLPDWLAPRVVREVTDDPAYLNFNLAVSGS